MEKKSFVTYEEFGAVGDGLTNDFEALLKTHEYANENGLEVRATPKKSYLITAANGKVIRIKTNTSWYDAEIIVDDTTLEKTNHDCTLPIFIITSDYEPYEVEEKYINKINENGGIRSSEIKKLENGLDYPALLEVINDGHKNYIRYGGDANNGAPQEEIIVVDKDGNIDKDTPFLLDYDVVTNIKAHRIDDEPITLEGGRFITRACQVDYKQILYYHRGISIARSNTTVKNIEHVVTGEPEEGAYPAYNGLLTCDYANNLYIEGVIFQGRKYYRYCGTYDICMTCSNKIVLKNCTQSNFFTKSGKMSIRDGYWGVMGSNRCKNITYDTCKLTRFDAHCGVWNGKIINSDLGEMHLTGGGEMLIENTRIYKESNIIYLRVDFGSTWKGKIILKDVTVHNDTTNVSLAYVGWCNHNFGYKTYFPEIVVDNLKLKTPTTVNFLRSESWGEWVTVYEQPDVNLETLSNGEKNENVYTPPKKIEIINNHEGYKYVAKRCPFLKDTEFIGFNEVVDV